MSLPVPLPPGANPRDRWLDLADQARDKAREALANGDRRMAGLWDEHERTLIRNAYEDVPFSEAGAPATGTAPTGTVGDLTGPINPLDALADDPELTSPRSVVKGEDGNLRMASLDSREATPLADTYDDMPAEARMTFGVADPALDGLLPQSGQIVDPEFAVTQAKNMESVPPLPKPKPQENSVPQSRPVDERVPGGKEDPWPESPVGIRFRNELFERESKRKGYATESPQQGRYQMTVGALQEIGMVDKTGKWTGKYGIRSAKAFRDNPTIQEMALSEYLQRLGGQLAVRGKQREADTPMDVAMRGQRIEGIAGEFNVSRNGLYAASHRWGAGMVRQYLNFQKAHGWKSDASKFPADKAEAFKAVETRLREFQNIEVWELDRKQN